MRARRFLDRPARVVPVAFLVAIAVGTGVLMLPVSRAGDAGAPFLTALFTSASATCVTGLVVVDTQTYWSPFGHVVIMSLIQLGGFGIMTLATLVGLVVSRRLGLRTRLLTQAETRSVGLGDVRRVVLRIALIQLSVELTVTAVLAARLVVGYGYSVPAAAWHGLFHSVAAFNNAGFALYSGNLVRFVTDPWVCLPIAGAVILGGIGFPVLFELAREVRTPVHWTIHTKITVLGTAVLLVVGTVSVLVLEWTNPRTLGPLDLPGKLLAGFFQGVQPRTAGFNTLDYDAMTDETLVVTDALMFIGGGSAGTAGGIKVTTFFLLAFVIWTEVRGEQEVTAFRRRVSGRAQRQAVSVALLGLGVVALGTLALLVTTGLPLGPTLFEAASAFGTVGLSTGVTPTLPGLAQVVLILLMYVGRVGPVSTAAAFALRDRTTLYRLPEERPIVG